MTLEAPPDARREAICPPFCMGHNTTTWLPWEQERATGDQVRSHVLEFGLHGGVNIYLLQDERRTGLDGRPVIRMLLDNPIADGFDDMNPTEAREVAAALIAAAEVLEAAQ